MSMERYSKQQLIRSAQFKLGEKDVLNAMLEEDGSYTLVEAKEVLELFLNKEVI